MWVKVKREVFDTAILDGEIYRFVINNNMLKVPH